jgi:hypothetical protein
MGQYYKAIILDDNNKPLSKFSPLENGNGSKLMGHSWMLHAFVNCVENQLIDKPKRLVWSGDYADNENYKTLDKDEVKTILKLNSDLDKDEIKKEGINLYTLCEIIDETKLNTGSFKKGKYLINFDKKEFVNKTKVPKDSDGWVIHPLPLLTCEGNDRGGSKINFYGDEKGLVGRWSRDIIGSSTNKTNIPKEFKEIIFDLVEKPYQY